MDASASLRDNGHILITLPKGAILVLTVDEFRLALQRGKARRRALQRAARIARQHAKNEADTLTWIT